jgi:hypothetical protein
MSNEYTVACYYFPNYHLDPRNERVHGKGWSEWNLVRRAEARYPGHRQPRVPLWGYEDESDPVFMARKIDAAADHGVDAFIFDWYWYDDGPFLERGLERGFLRATNNGRMKFGLMWANHDWKDIHPARLGESRQGFPGGYRVLYPGAVSRPTFDTIVETALERYFQHPSYWLVEGCPYFSIYDLPCLVDGLGGVEATQQALAHFRARVKAEGFRDLHLNGVLWNPHALSSAGVRMDASNLVETFGFDSVTSYVWIHHARLDAFPETDYNRVRDAYLAYADRIAREISVPYYPNITMGWDSSPRTLPSDTFEEAVYPFMPALAHNTPENFRSALELVRQRLAEKPPAERICTINAWNEWTEGSYLEPDTETGLAYLQAVRDIFFRICVKNH